MLHIIYNLYMYCVRKTVFYTALEHLEMEAKIFV